MYLCQNSSSVLAKCLLKLHLGRDINILHQQLQKEAWQTKQRSLHTFKMLTGSGHTEVTSHARASGDVLKPLQEVQKAPANAATLGSKLRKVFIGPHLKDALMQAASTTDLTALDDLKAEHEACLAAVEHTFKRANVELEAGSVDETFRCPITEESFREPVSAPSGTSFERSAIHLWLVVIDFTL